MLVHSFSYQLKQSPIFHFFWCNNIEIFISILKINTLKTLPLKSSVMHFINMVFYGLRQTSFCTNSARKKSKVKKTNIVAKSCEILCTE